MVKVYLNLRYKDRTIITSCQRHEIPGKIEECFQINFSDVYLCTKSGEPISNLQDITDVMKIQIIDKQDGLKSLRSQNETSSNKLVNSIISKLEKNSSLSGDERRSMIEWLKRDSLLDYFSKKRKGDDDDAAHKKRTLDEANCSSQRREKANKQSQTRILRSTVKDGFTQTGEGDVAHKNSEIDEDNCSCSCQRRQKANQERVQTPTVKDDFTQTDGLIYTPKEVDATELIEEMKKLAVRETLDDDLAEYLMTVTFEERRNFIVNKEPSVTLIKSKYPLLFVAKNEVKNELNRIFYSGICKDFLKNMQDYSKVILGHCKENDKIRVMTEKRIARAHTPSQKVYAEVVGSVFALSDILGEEYRFIHLLNYPHGSDDAYPHIDVSYYSLKECFFDNVIFNIVVEGLHLCKASNFHEAILCLVSSFYVFNINYPESCKRTLTCFEKMYLNANDTEVDEETSQIIELFSLQVKAKQNA